MRPLLPFCLAITLFVPAALAQQSQTEVRLSGAAVEISAPPDWRLSHAERDSAEIYVPLRSERRLPFRERNDENVKPAQVIASEAGMLITTERRRDHAEAVRRLAEIAAERPEEATPLVINGWPAIERRYRALMPQPGQQEIASGRIETSFTTTAVAMDDLVVRFETMLAPDADPRLLDQALAIGRSWRGPPGPPETSRRELEEVRQMARPPQNVPPPASTPPPAPGPGMEPRPGGGEAAGVAVQVQTGRGELEVATNDGQHVVVAANSGYSYSANSGASYTFGGGTPCNQVRCDGDPSLAVGNSGAFYYAWIGGPSSSSLGDGVSRSTDNGQTFPFRGLAATCPGTTGCTVADQEHIAADRNNAAAGGGDRLYNVWRNFAPTFSIRISCSTDGGATWTAGTAIGAGDLPRVSVGGDGFVYVAWASGGNMMLHKYSNCDAGLTPQAGWPVTVSAFTNVVCPVAGLDRCNGRNILSSPKVAVDDLDPNHVYYAFATSTGAGNENVMVFDSTNGGASFPRSVQVNGGGTARRFMPWISTYGGIAMVSWYDRRTATAANNDRTRYYVGGAAVRGPNLVALTERDLSGADDAQCSTWPCGTDVTTDSESCSVQPQLAGRCWVTANCIADPVNCCENSIGCSGAPACDFSSPACSAGLVCADTRGCPKYGDYNGNAAGAGLFYTAWASATPPASVGGAAGAIRVYASADAIPSDFYVRDWNDSPSSFDNGAQPSTHGDFWSTSDVWNQSTSTAAAPGPGGFVVGDPPSRTGSNFVFARVSRRAAAMATAASAPVTVNFLRGDFGLGAAFAPAGSESITFAAGDMTRITPGHSWPVPAASSIHLCLAVQIDGPDGDTFALPSVAGTAPGPADPFILQDNNKAQRNLQDTIGTSAGTELIAVVRNAETQARPMRLRISVPQGVRISGLFEVLGGNEAGVSARALDGARLDLGQMAAGETRWLRFHATSLAGLDGPVPVHVFEDTDPPSNGFTIWLHRESVATVARRNLATLAGVLLRLAEIEDDAQAERLAGLTLRESREADGNTYAAYLSEHRAEIGRIVARHLRAAAGDERFGIGAAAEDLWSALADGNVEAAAAANTALIERLDAHLTALSHAGFQPGAGTDLLASFHVGSAHPLGGLSDVADANIHIRADLGYSLTDRLRLLLAAGFSQFTAETAAGIEHPSFLNASANAQLLFPLPTGTSFFLQGGPGVYWPKSGSSDLGFNVGLGFQLPITTRYRLEIGTDYHSVTGDESFLTLQLGVLF
ncbi:MAG: WD40/YVTN/BNR-like repeat-containing protein [Thermoanaerobaculia bacterium]